LIQKKSPGQIITFYSYKGGTGRSMALANLAWILASNGKRVLCLDWDLEAPGLHRYFHPFMVDKELASSEGLIDFVFKFAAAAATPQRKETSPVYLAQTDPKLEPLREAVRNVLLKSGYSVLPEEPLPLDTQEFETTVRDHLKRSKMSVNLISQAPAESEQYPYIYKQVSLAGERAIEPTFSHLIWVSPDVSEVPSAILESESSDGGPQTKLLRGPLDVLFEAIREHTRKNESDADWYKPYANILRYASSLSWTFTAADGSQNGSLDLIPAGRQGPSYSTRVNSFNWQNFYDRLGGGILLEMAKERMRAEYDYILIDSRTGVSDTSGVCTVQMPDTLVVCLTFNHQSIEGAAAVAESVHAQRPDVRIFPVPTRVEKFEKERLDIARETARRKFDHLLDHMKEDEKNRYWGRVEVFYEPFYAYEELLAVFGDKPDQTNSLLASIERLAGYVTNNEVTKLVPVTEADREVVKTRYQRQRLPRQSEVTPADSSGDEFWFYLSCSLSDDSALIRKFFDDLSREVRVRLGLTSTMPVGFLGSAGVTFGPDLNASVIPALENSRLLVALCSPNYFKSDQCGKEFQFFSEQTDVTDPDRHLSTILPVTWVPTPASDTPAAAEEIQRGLSSPEGGVRQLVSLKKRSDEYVVFLDETANRVTEMAKALPSLSFRKKPPLIGIKSAFEKQPALPSATVDRGVRTVNFIYVVGEKQELAKIRDNVSSYGSTSDQWRPFPATDLTIGSLSLETAGNAKLFASVVPIGTDINNLVRRAEQDKAIVILVIDAWSLLVSRVNDLLRSFDRYEFANCGIVSVMNERDRETVSMRDQLVRALRDTFPFQTVGASDLLTEVGTEEEFRSVLLRYFNELTARMVSLGEKPYSN
jgi:FxsC-like protein